MNYLPNINENSCISLDYLESNFIRVYDSSPIADSTISYTDYFPKLNYFSRSGYQNFDSNNYQINCVDHQNFTDDYYYRYDFFIILFIFLIFTYFIIYIPIKIWSKLFKRGSL